MSEPQTLLLQRRLPYRLLRTTRGNHHLNTSQLPFGLRFTFSLIPGTDQSSTPVPHLHTHISHTHTRTCCEVLICLAVISERSNPCVLSCYLTLDCLPVILIVCCLPRLGLCLLDCDRLPPALISCLVFDSVSALPVSDLVLPDYSQ